MKLLSDSLVSTILSLQMFTGVLVLLDIVDDEIKFESISETFRNWVTFNWKTRRKRALRCWYDSCCESFSSIVNLQSSDRSSCKIAQT